MIDMGRCVYCHSVVTRNEDQCYVCGDSVPRQKRTTAKVRGRPVSGFTNLVFLASLGFTAYCFLAQHKLSLMATIAISSTLLLVRILAEKLAGRNSRTPST
jgi:hypothetical protein